MPDLTRLTPDGRLQFHFHPGQWAAWNASERIVLALAGAQGGKTELGPPWLLREIQRRGPGDYLVVTPTYPLLSKKALPAFLRLFSTQLHLGRYRSQAKVFVFSESGEMWIHGAASGPRHGTPTQVFFCHASDPESLESATAKAAWLDEAGQRAFRLGSWEAVQRRLAIHQGRILITTTPYNLGWLQQQVFQPWEDARRKGRRHPHIAVVQFDSRANPSFPREEFDRAARELPRWKFDMFYRGRFTRPAGLIYDRFSLQHHVRPRFALPLSWPHYVGLDFGAVHTVAVFLAEEQDPHGNPTGRMVAYREYLPNEKREPDEHARALLQDEMRLPVFAGGAYNEDEWRARFRAAGIPVSPPPVRDVEVGIDTVFEMIARDELLVHDHLTRLLDELGSYSRVLDEKGQPTREIDGKSSYHLLDALRYITVWLRRGGRGAWTPSCDPRNRSEMDRAPAGVFLS